MEVCKDRDTVASRILNVFRHQEEHHNLLRRLADREIENEGESRDISHSELALVNDYARAPMNEYMN